MPALQLLELGHLAQPVTQRLLDEPIERVAGLVVISLGPLPLPLRLGLVRLRLVDRLAQLRVVDEQARRQGQGRQHTDRHQRGGRRLAPRPLPGALPRPHRPRHDRPALHKAVQILGQGRGAAVAPARFLFEALEANRLQVARQLRLQTARRHRLLRPYLLQRLQQARRLERRPARQALVQNGPQGVHVRRRADVLVAAGRLFRRHVARRPQDGAGCGLRCRRFVRTGQLLCQAEVGNQWGAVGGQEDVGRLEVPVHDPLRMRRVNGACQSLRQLGRLPYRQSRARELVREAAAVGKLSREIRPAVMLADGQHAHDLGMAQPRQRLAFGAEALQPVAAGVSAGVQHFQGDDAPGPILPGREHDAHAAVAQDAQDAVGTDPAQFVGGSRRR